MSTYPPLRDALADYLALRRALGFKLANADRLLGQFVDYLDGHGVDTPTTDHALAWATLPADASTAWRAIRLSVVRGFAAYLHGIDPTVEVPPAGLLRHGPDRATPYLYSDHEIRALIAAAARLRPRLRAATYQTLTGLLAVSGIRIGEATALDTTDLDTDGGLLVVRHTKFDKSRLVPLHPTTMRALTSYLDLRDQTHPHPASPALLVGHHRSPAAPRQHRAHLHPPGPPGRDHPPLGDLPTPHPRPATQLRRRHHARLVPHGG